MMDLKNITPEIAEKCGENSNRYFDTVRFSAVEMLRTLMNELPQEAVLIGANMVNAYRRDDLKEHLDFTPESYIEYTLKDFVVYIEFGHFWMFEGVMAYAYPLLDGKYRTTKYPVYFNVSKKDGILDLIEAARKPSEIYTGMTAIKVESSQDLMYMQTPRKVEVAIYTH